MQIRIFYKLRAMPAALCSLVAASLLVSLSGSARADVAGERQVKTASAEYVSEPNRSGKPNVADTADFVQQVIELTNRERLDAGLPALKRQKDLEAAAIWMARDMSDHSYFDHRDSGRREMPARLREFNYCGYHALGENIASGQHTPEEVVDAWMNSPGHRANILSSKFSEMGVSYAPPSPRNAYGYWVQDFGSRFGACPIVINNDVARTSSSRVKLSIPGVEWVEQMRLSNDEINWTAWEAFRPLCDWSLESGTGARSVFVEIRRAARIERLQAEVRVDSPELAIRLNPSGRNK